MTTDIRFDKAADVHSIPVRLAPIDVGFDLRLHGEAIPISRSLDPLRVSYATITGERRVCSGPQNEVLALLRRHGYYFTLTD
jgi:hypothetical protein